MSNPFDEDVDLLEDGSSVQNVVFRTQFIEKVIDLEQFDDVETKIIKERNEEIRQLEEDTTHLAEIQRLFSMHIAEQAEGLDQACENTKEIETDVHEATVHLEDAYKATDYGGWKYVPTLATLGITVSGLAVCVFHPFIGIPTVLGGLGGSVLTFKKFVNK